MANNAFCTYICEGAHDDIKQVFDILQKTAPKSKEYYWIGDVVNQLGMDAARCDCLGEILTYEIKNGLLHIHQRTRWGEQRVLREAIQKRFPSIKIYYSCMDYLGGTNYTNSFEHFPTRYVLYASGDSIPFESIQEMSGYTSKLVGYSVEANIESVLNALKKYEVQSEEDYEHFEITKVDYRE